MMGVMVGRSTMDAHTGSCSMCLDAEAVPKLYLWGSLPLSVMYFRPSGPGYFRISLRTRAQPSRQRSSCSLFRQSLTTTKPSRWKIFAARSTSQGSQISSPLMPLFRRRCSRKASTLGSCGSRRFGSLGDISIWPKPRASSGGSLPSASMVSLGSTAASQPAWEGPWTFRSCSSSGSSLGGSGMAAMARAPPRPRRPGRRC
mmetsp:Transcript_16701/g.47623  ORF Transcript_16701/g.47623 Transcript_16701/m.47623 type:complete len:201 (+) Transcript_16701:932-1534(+)